MEKETKVKLTEAEEIDVLRRQLGTALKTIEELKDELRNQSSHPGWSEESSL